MAADTQFARSKVLAAIAVAFEGVRLEDGVSIHEAGVMDDYGSDNERAAARALDTEADWRDVPTRDIERMYWVWSYFDAKGFRFYLPAALSWWVNACNSKSNSAAIECVLGSLALRHGSIKSISEEQVRLLTFQQLEAVRMWLDWLAEADMSIHNEARQAAKRIRQLLA